MQPCNKFCIHVADVDTVVDELLDERECNVDSTNDDVSITDKSNENDDHIVALSELLDDFCKQNERIEVPKISELQDLLNMDVPSDTG